MTYDLTNYLIIELETINAFATMTYIVETYLCGLRPMDEEVFNGFINMSCKEYLSHIFYIIFLAYIYEWGLKKYTYSFHLCMYLRGILALCLYVYCFFMRINSCILGVLTSWLFPVLTMTVPLRYTTKYQ